jgi:hypothetical protein
MQNFEVWKLRNSLLVGYQPVILHATVSTRVLDERPPEPGDKKPRCEIRWLPDDAVLNYLSAVLTHLNQLKPSLDRLLLRLTLKGNFIWSAEALSLFKKGTPGGYLDGEALRAPRDFDAHEIALPSGDGRRGGDFEMWFWLAPQPTVKASDKVTDVKTSDVKVTEVKVTDAKVTDAKATEVKTVEVKVSDRAPASSVGEPVSTTKKQGRRKPKGRSFITPEERPEPGPETREDPGKRKARAPRDRKPSR